jgi:hypothetical protein
MNSGILVCSWHVDPIISKFPEVANESNNDEYSNFNIADFLN